MASASRRPILFVVLGIWLYAVPIHGQTPSQAPQGEKHFGSVCAKLTGDSQCKVCAPDTSSQWTCYSHSLWQEIPGTALPVAPESSPSKPVRRSNFNSDPDSCPNWSPKFDEIQDDEALNVLRQQESAGWNSATANNLSGLKGALRQVEDSLSQVDEAINALGGGDYHSVDQHECKNGQGGALKAALCERLNRQNMILTLQGTLEIAGCHCQAVSNYRNQLKKNFDTAMSQYSIFNKGMLDQEKYAKDTLNLMNDEWWAGQTGAEVASQVKYFTDMINHVIGMVVPESEAVEVVKHGAVTVDVLNAEVQDGAKQASKEALKAVAKELAEEIAGPILGMELDTIEYKEREEGMDAYKAQVQQRVSAIEKTVRSFNTKMKQSKARARAVDGMMAQIDHACVSAPDIQLTPR